MKGIVFTELIEMVENDLGFEIADRMIVAADLDNGGAFTAVGTYDHSQLIQLVVSLSAETGIEVPELVRSFGKHLFMRFHELYPHFFEGINSALQFLPLVEKYIHVEVRKLYPEAELPSFECEESNGILKMTYSSTRPFADLAEGLILSCIDHFGKLVNVDRFDLEPYDGTHACFTLTPITAKSTVSTSSNAALNPQV